MSDGSGRVVVHIGFDHAGVELNGRIMAELERAGFEPVSHGPVAYDPDDDYPAFCIAAAEAVARDRAAGLPSLGVVIGGSGNGEQMAANLVRGIRAALVWNEDTARLARAHNDANVVSVGARQHTIDECLRLILLFLLEPFSGEERHARRIGQMAAYEERRDRR